ncbi:MAG: hypothetical protein GY714_15175 [Desulfobacterales bacterium]|nr:hypothetical protein [Desulfobacterales bacterium]MCP4162107.1 hypothetical protein [Deltaproteobacteria bacterium]
MGEALQTIVVDDISYSVRFKGFHNVMEVYKSNGDIINFLPVNYHDQMNALRLSLLTTTKGLELSYKKFCKQILSICNPGSEEYPYIEHELYGLALWWVSCGDGEVKEKDLNGWLDIGTISVRLKPWKNVERIFALSNNLTNDESGDSFDVVGYLDAMIRASVEEINPAIDLNELDTISASKLIDAVSNLNISEDSFQNEISDRETANGYVRTTLKICSFLGWTPSQVDKIPAPEADRLLELIDFVGPSQNNKETRSSALTDHPDTHLFKFEDD